MARTEPTPLKALLLSMEYTPSVSGGVGTYVYELARGLARSGCQVTVLSYTPGEASTLREPGLVVHMLPPSGSSFAEASRGSLVRGLRAFNDDLVQQGRRLLREERADIIHHHQWHTHEAARRLGEEFGLPVVGTSHYISEPAEHWWGQTPDPEIVQQERGFYDGRTPVITVSHSMSQLIQDTYGLAAERLHVIHCAMDLEPFTRPGHPPETFARLRATVARPEDAVVLYTGRLHPMKGISALFASAERVLARRPQVRYLLAGGTDSRESTRMMHQLCERYAHLMDRIKLLGKLPRPQLGLLHRIADVALVPSVYEPFGYTAIETMASGVPVIASRQGGLAEIIEHQRTGLLVPVRPAEPPPLREVDAEQLAQAQLELLEAPARARQLGEAGQHHVIGTFGLERMVAANLDVYRHLLATGRAAAA